jgi:hypothetical protein
VTDEDIAWIADTMGLDAMDGIGEPSLKEPVRSMCRLAQVAV